MMRILTLFEGLYMLARVQWKCSQSNHEVRLENVVKDELQFFISTIKFESKFSVAKCFIFLRYLSP